MAYINEAYITERMDDHYLVIWTAESGTSYDSTVIEKCITDAESKVNDYLNKRYTVPLEGSDITDGLKRLTFDIAIYYISGVRNQNDPLSDIYQRYKEAIRNLDKIANGDLDLTGVESIADNSLTQVIHTNVDDDTRVMSVSKIRSKRGLDSL